MSSRGFTIVEVLICVAIIGIIAAVGVGFDFFVNSYNLAEETFMFVYVHSDLQRKGVLCIEKMIRGVEGYKGLQEAADISIPAAVGAADDKIVFIDGEDPSVSRQFYLSDDKVIYADEAGVTQEILEGDVQSLTFTKVQDDLIEINLSLQRAALGKTVAAELTTSVNLRNY